MNIFLADKHFKIHVGSFDDIINRFTGNLTSFSEKDALKESHWDIGEDARLREDMRFRPTPWGRWMLSDCVLANDAIYRKFQDGVWFEINLEEAVQEVATSVDSPCVWCSADPRFVIENGILRLATKELSKQPLIVEPIDLEKYTTHLPISTLEAVAASMPSGEWGPEAQEFPVEPLGWLRVSIPGRRLNNKMFVAKIKGNSMNDGRSGLKDGVYAVFELWPVGTRQNLVVLVRGSFKDPETGNFAVKKYVADKRDSEGRHQLVKLKSLNPDKEKYPDIELEPRDDEDIRILARFIAALSPDDFARKPKKLRKTGRRDLTSEDGKTIIENRLRRTAECLFAREPGEEIIVSGEEKDQWKSRIVCLDAESGALCIETDPLVGLPSFAKKITVNTDNLSWTVLGANLRNHVCRTPVDPSIDTYRWSAPGHEEMLDEDLCVLNRDGFSETSVTLFKVDASGIGRQVATNTLAQGADYRILIPPIYSNLHIPSENVYTLVNGWRLWEVAVYLTLNAELGEVLKKLGLKSGKSSPLTTWILVSPVRYEQSERGDVYPCFAADRSPLLFIQGVKTFTNGELYVFLLGDEMISQPLPLGSSWTIRFESLPPGNYIAEVLHRQTRIKSTRMPFAIEGNRPSQVTASVIVDLVDEHKTIEGDMQFSSRNLDMLKSDELQVTVECPPLWPVDPWWNTETKNRLDRFHANEYGKINSEVLTEAVGERSIDSPLADFILDFHELGRATFQHRRAVNPNTIRKQLAELVDERAGSLKGIEGQFKMIRELWLDPVLRLLNYSIGNMPSDLLFDAPDGTTAFLLEETRRKKGVISKIANRILVLAQPNILADNLLLKELYKFTDQLCDMVEIDRALVTDGLQWLPHRVGMGLHVNPFDLREVVKDNSRNVFENFLFICAVGIQS
ncbi:hypothetical protein D1BOALGB6SA_8349 [Olavius sp. associated proteobacterium Delta 1]|nr:hypothetical protein D1BOALGB6SA_8349 [Olavius sp. associated proteobacterium Delta 1]